MRFDPAVLSVRTWEYLQAGVEDVAGTVTEPTTWVEKLGEIIEKWRQKKKWTEK